MFTCGLQPAAGEVRRPGCDGSPHRGRCCCIGKCCTDVVSIQVQGQGEENQNEDETGPGRWLFNVTLCPRVALVASIKRHLLTLVCTYYLALPLRPRVFALSRPCSLASSESCNNLHESRTPAGQAAGLFSVLPTELRLFHGPPL